MKFSILAATGLMAAATALSAPANADPVDTAFLNSLGQAGFSTANPGDTVALGQSVCPMLVEPGKSFASVASEVGLTQGLSPEMASFFTGIAIQMYCPQMMSSIGNGTFINGLGNGFGIPGL